MLSPLNCNSPSDATLTSVPGHVIPIEPVLLFTLLLKVIQAVVSVIPYAS